MEIVWHLYISIGMWFAGFACGLDKSWDNFPAFMFSNVLICFFWPIVFIYAVWLKLVKVWEKKCGKKNYYPDITLVEKE